MAAETVTVAGSSRFVLRRTSSCSNAGRSRRARGRETQARRQQCRGTTSHHISKAIRLKLPWTERRRSKGRNLMRAGDPETDHPPHLVPETLRPEWIGTSPHSRA
jgi:hypothetical protein